MQNITRNTLFALMCILFFNGTDAMNSEPDMRAYPNNDQSGCIIPVYGCWEQDYSANIHAVKNLNLQEMISQLEREQYLPATASSLEHLLYLATVQKNDDSKTPFSKKEQKKFDTAFTIRRQVPWFFWINAGVIIVTSLFGYSNFVALSQCSQSNQADCLSSVSVIATPATITCIGALAVGFMSLYATGVLPDISARKGDKVQDKIGDLRSHYLTLAKYWIDIYFESPEKALEIAQCIDMNALQERIIAKTHNKQSGDKLVNPLKEAWHFITYKHILVTFTEIESYLYSKMNSQQIVSFYKRMDCLEKRINYYERALNNAEATIAELSQKIGQNRVHTQEDV